MQNYMLSVDLPLDRITEDGKNTGFTFSKKLDEALSKETSRTSTSYDVDADEESVSVILFGSEPVKVNWGYPNTRWEPGEPKSLEGFIRKDDLLNIIVSAVNTAEPDSDVDAYDLKVTDSEGLSENAFWEAEREEAARHGRGRW